MINIEYLKQNSATVATLASIPFEFDLLALDDDDSWLEFDPHCDFEIIAGDYCGGSYVASRGEADHMPIYHVSSEAKVSRIGNNLRDALEHIVAMPFWRDTAHTDLELMNKRTKERMAEQDDRVKKEQNQLAQYLRLDIATDHTARLHASLAVGLQTRVLVNGEQTINGFATNWNEL